MGDKTGRNKKRGPLELEELQNIRSMLRGHAEKAIKLAESLKSYGEIPLTKGDLLLIRVTHLHIINEMTEMLRVNFIAGNDDNMREASEEIFKINDFLNSI